ncbi:MAG: hypothetical protein ACRDQ2_08735 [Gaiellales bacterium]
MAETAMGSDLDELVLLAGDAGLAKQIAPVAAARARAAEIDQEARKAEAESVQLSRRIAERIAAGDIDFAEGLAEHRHLGTWLQRPSWSERRALGPGLRDAARGACNKAARSCLEQHAEKIAALARSKKSSAGEAVLRWLARYGYIEPPRGESPRSEGAQVPTPGHERLWIGG